MNYADNAERVRQANAGKPKIGIRPIIDGRIAGVREVLENQVMALSRSVADLLTGALRYPDGSPVECVVADTSIGGIAEAVAVDRAYQRESVGVSISVAPAWAFGIETMDMTPAIPKAVWGFNGTERSGAVYMAAVLAAHNQMGLPAFGIYGRQVQDKDDNTIPDDVAAKLLLFTNAGLAVALMRGRSYLSIGSVSMGIAGSSVDRGFFQDYLGMRCESVDMVELVRRVEEGIYDPDEYTRAMAWVKRNCPEGADNNPPAMQQSRERKDQNWETSVKMTLIMRDLMVGNSRLADQGFCEEALGRNAILAGFQGQRHWNDHFCDGDFSEAILNSSFDWNGIRAPYLMATENDGLNGVSMLFGHLLSHTAQVFADVRTYWDPAAVKRVTGHTLNGDAANGIIHLTNSGSAALDGTGRQLRDGRPVMKPYWEITPDEMAACLEATTWRPAHAGYFRGGGFSSNFLTRGGMPVTLIRVNLVRHLGPVLQLAEGVTVDLPEAVHRTLDERTDPTWPTTWFAPRLSGTDVFTDVYQVMNAWGANHGAFAYGHIGAELITLASMLRIPVAMHNVTADRILRPATWGAFGTKDLEDADYRACAAYGPLYG